jgi:hypothetical protein
VSRFGRLINAGFGRCKHRVLGTCVDAADGCCAGVACAICVKLLDSYGEVVDGASFAWDGTGYSGSVGGFSFESYWLDNYGDCEFHVIITAGGYIEPIHIIKTKVEPSPVGHNQGCSPSPGPVVSNDPDEACCMNPEGETEVDDGDNTYTMTWGPVDPLILARRPVITSACAQIDIAIVVDDTSSMASVISSLQTEIGNLVTAVDAISDSFQFSLITFKDTTTQTVSFSINNAAAINAAVAAMTTGMGNQIPEASDIALNEAVVQSGWRAAAQKVIVLITDAPPGGLDDVADPADVTNLNAGGTAAGVADQYMYCIGVGTNAAMISAMTSTAAAAVATGGGGKYETLTPGNIVTNVIALIDALCPPVTCHERFCGDCDCAPRKLCLQVSSDGCSVTNIISLAENYADPDCPLPVWDLDFTCGTFSFSGQVALVRDEYTDGCILQMSGTRGGAEEEESHDYAVTDCTILRGNFTLTEDYVDYIITISPSDCDECDIRCGPYCCEDRPEVLYMHIIPTAIDSNSGGGVEPDCEACACAANYNIALILHDECAIISDEESGWRTGTVFGEKDLGLSITCAEGLLTDHGIQLLCSGTGDLKSYRLVSPGLEVEVSDATVTGPCGDVLSLYFPNGSHTLGPCNSNLVHFDILITDEPLTTDPTPGTITGCP